MLSAAGSLTVNESGNIRLAGTSQLLTDASDKLTLLCDGVNWLQVAFSDNG